MCYIIYAENNSADQMADADFVYQMLLMCTHSLYLYGQIHGGEARDLKLEIPGNPLR